MLFVNNLNQNGSHDQKMKFLPKACSGEMIGGMCMSEPGKRRLHCGLLLLLVLVLE